MNHFAITSAAVSGHEHWHEAAQHVATATGAPRTELWFRTGHGEGLAVFQGRSNTLQTPIARILNPVEYQSARSRGDLEDLSQFVSGAAGNSSEPALPTQPLTTMKKAPSAPKPKTTHRKAQMRQKPVRKKPAVAEQFSLIADKDIPTSHRPDTGVLEMLDPRLIMPSPVNPRRHFDEEAMVELTDSVRERGVRVAINVRLMPENHWFVEPGKSGGVEGWFIFDRRRFYLRKAMLSGVSTSIQDYHHLPADLFEYFYPTEEAAKAAIPKYEIIAGERRWRAARRAGVATIRALVETMNDQEAAELQVVENDQREDLTPVETAAGYQHLLSLPGYSMDQLVRKVGKAANTIYGRLKLLALPEPVQQAVARGELATVTAERIGRLEGDLQAKAVAAILQPARDEDDEDGKALTDREAKEAIEDLQEEQQRIDLQSEAKNLMEAKGYRVLQGKGTQGIISYSDRIAHNCGYVAAEDVCSRDPAGRKWREIVESRDATGLSVLSRVSKLAVIANSHREGYKGVAIYHRDEVNALLKELGLWQAEGSKATRESAEREAAKEKAGREREAMMQDMDAIADAARRERSPRNSLLAAVWAVTGTPYGHAMDAVTFVAKRRAWISLDDTESDVCSQVRSMATDIELDDLQALVVELAIAQMDDEESYFNEGREEMRRLFDLEFSGEGKSASARTEEPAELEDALI